MKDHTRILKTAQKTILAISFIAFYFLFVMTAYAAAIPAREDIPTWDECEEESLTGSEVIKITLTSAEVGGKYTVHIDNGTTSEMYLMSETLCVQDMKKAVNKKSDSYVNKEDEYTITYKRDKKGTLVSVLAKKTEE